MELKKYTVFMCHWSNRNLWATTLEVEAAHEGDAYLAAQKRHPMMQVCGLIEGAYAHLASDIIDLRQAVQYSQLIAIPEDELTSEDLMALANLEMSINDDHEAAERYDQMRRDLQKR